MPDAPAVKKIISGGQTGVDRAALDVALALGLPCGGWVPRGRRAEDGRLDDRYPMRETASSAYHVRTRRNVLDADATLILTRGTPTGGTALTIEIARAEARPVCIVDLAAPEPPELVASWLTAAGARVLNVAGPRESSAPGIGHEAADYLRAVLIP